MGDFDFETLAVLAVGIGALLGGLGWALWVESERGPRPAPVLVLHKNSDGTDIGEALGQILAAHAMRYSTHDEEEMDMQKLLLELSFILGITFFALDFMYFTEVGSTEGALTLKLFFLHNGIFAALGLASTFITLLLCNLVQRVRMKKA